jgi:IS5 family transposase
VAQDEDGTLFTRETKEARALHGNPCDGHTLKAALDEVRNTVGRNPSCVAVDQGYKGHRLMGHPHSTVQITRQRRGVTEKINRWQKGRNGDRSNVVFAAVGFNFRQLPRFPRAKSF